MNGPEDRTQRCALSSDPFMLKGLMLERKPPALLP